MMAYRYDVFISYTWRVRRAQAWVRGVLAPPLLDYLELESRVPSSRVFLDEREVRPGIEVEPAIHDALRDSKVLLAVLSPQYFESGWCLTEFRTMLERQRRTGHQCIYPLRVWDGDHYDDDARRLDLLPLNQWGSLEPGMRRKRWNDVVRDIATQLGSIAAKAPPHDPGAAVVPVPDPPPVHVAREGY